ncbi:hypothetical protein [Acinetobacter radioresistens]|uniref:hypothetical protein n=1 Tax=Acinetobacter radioresistens TaxID=40216 RepID=UPI000C34CBA1|nr:hypothetical protein [Acinetobacter radioresistens]PKD85437.1 hypothetical protein CW313_01360 [Acinetobacter radioresistens]
MTSQKRMLITGLLSGLIYGLWTYYINFGADNVLLSAWTQAINSFIGGYMVAGLVEFSYKVIPAPYKFMVSACVPYALLMILYAFIHNYIGTKHVFYTILPNILIGFPYFFLYFNKLEKNSGTVVNIPQG